MNEVKRELDNLESVCWINDTEISHLLMSHAGEYNQAELSGFIACEQQAKIEAISKKVDDKKFNLIDELGGYDCAIANYKDRWFDDDESYTIKSTSTKFTGSELKQQLLEYRRENKIFEVGDKVIYYILGNGVIEYEEWLSTQDRSCIRHATDKEIEAGKRLDSN